MQEKENISKVDSNIFIRDFVIVGKSVPKPDADADDFEKFYTPAGEFNPPEYCGGHSINSLENEEQMINRLENAIKKLITKIAIEHQVNCLANSNELLLEKKNQITRGITNEFFFYTNKPFTMEQFQNLQQRISDFAKVHPENLHFVLGSFAVLTPDNKVMNIVPQIQCGSAPIFHFIVKNSTTSIDPIYQNHPQNVSAEEGDDIADLKITIDNQECPLSFQNLHICKSANQIEFISGIDICADTGLTAMRIKNKKEAEEILPSLVSHIVVSNSLDMTSLPFDILTHADPCYSHKKLNYNTNQTFLMTMDLGFGTPAYIYQNNALPCSKVLTDYFIDMALERAINSGKIESVKKWIDLRKNIDDTLDDGTFIHFGIKREYSPLDLAVHNRDAEMAQFLIQQGADPNKPQTNGLTKLSVAIFQDDTNMMTALKENGAREDIPVFENGPLPTVYEELCKEYRNKINKLVNLEYTLRVMIERKSIDNLDSMRSGVDTLQSEYEQFLSLEEKLHININDSLLSNYLFLSHDKIGRFKQHINEVQPYAQYVNKYKDFINFLDTIPLTIEKINALELEIAQDEMIFKSFPDKGITQNSGNLMYFNKAKQVLGYLKEDVQSYDKVVNEIERIRSAIAHIADSGKFKNISMVVEAVTNHIMSYQLEPDTRFFGKKIQQKYAENANAIAKATAEIGNFITYYKCLHELLKFTKALKKINNPTSYAIQNFKLSCDRVNEFARQFEISETVHQKNLTDILPFYQRLSKESVAPYTFFRATNNPKNENSENDAQDNDKKTFF